MKANEAYVSGPLTRTGNFQGRGRGPRNAFTLSYVFKSLQSKIFYPQAAGYCRVFLGSELTKTLCYFLGFW